tara:strand:+ start:330 stop:590 length:261 start_codon:yes stop_codon:yes gene_type:complete
VLTQNYQEEFRAAGYKDKDKRMMSYTKSKLDRLVEKMISRKFLVWLTATGLLTFSDLASSDWVIISAIYIGGQTVIDGIAKLKGIE